MLWSVPAHARKAVSQIYLGNLQDALLSSEKALLLDNANPVSISFIFCNRFLVVVTMDQKAGDYSY